MRKSRYSSQQKELQNQLRKLRVDSGLRQSDMARRLGKTQSFVSKYESGERLLDLLELQEICRVLNISLSEFVKDFEENPK